MRAVKKEWLLGMLCVLSGVMLMVIHPVQAQAGGSRGVPCGV